MRLGRPRRAGLLVAALLSVAAAAAPSSASAATFGCEASAVRGTVLGGVLGSAVTLEPVVANRGAPCKTSSAGINVPLPGLLSASAVSANTVFSGSQFNESAEAAGGLADIRVAPLLDLPITLPTPEIGEALANVTVPLDGLLAGLGLGNSVSLDLRPALQALVPDGMLPTAELLSVQVATSRAVAKCTTGGTPQFSGASNTAGISVLGQDLPAGQLVDQVLTLIDTSNIDPSNVDLSMIELPPGLSFAAPITGLLLQTVVQTVLDAIPPIAIPATIAEIKATPGVQTRTATSLTQQALNVQVSVAGINLVDLVVGEAKVSAAGACGPPPAPAAPAAPVDLVLGCDSRRLVLKDVKEVKGRVRLIGVADRKLAGQEVSIRFQATAKVVVKTKINPDGSFTARTPLPDSKVRFTNRARYRAEVGKEKSLNLKLIRRMISKTPRNSGGKITLSGRLVLPLAKPIVDIIVRQQVSCDTQKVIKRFRPDKDGDFSVEIPTPDGSNGAPAAVYRLLTRVRNNKGNPKTFPTFTLPFVVDLK